jgi:hypothetical protein
MDFDMKAFSEYAIQVPGMSTELLARIGRRGGQLN